MKAGEVLRLPISCIPHENNLWALLVMGVVNLNNATGRWEGASAMPTSAINPYTTLHPTALTLAVVSV